MTAYVSEIDMVTPLGLTSAWDAASGTLTISGAAPKATYQEILRSVVFSNTDYTPVIDTRTVEIRVTDETSYSDPATITLGFRTSCSGCSSSRRPPAPSSRSSSTSS